MNLDIKKGAGEYIVVHPTLFSMVRTAYAPAGGCEIKRFEIKFEAGRDAEVALDIKNRAGLYIVVRPTLFFMVGAAYAPGPPKFKG